MWSLHLWSGDLISTPECEDDDTETKLYTKADVNVRKEAGKIAG